jgi:hypothetical protein
MWADAKVGASLQIPLPIRHKPCKRNKSETKILANPQPIFQL